jgi:tetratricopeptide (TPR) repeat protein
VIRQGLAGPLDLAWAVEGKALKLRAAAELSTAEAAEWRRLTARRAVRDAIFVARDHPLSGPTFLEVGNLEASENRLNEAIAWYRQLLQPGRSSPFAAEASYDLGLALKRQGSPYAAVEAFYRAVDQAPGGELAPWSRLWIGRILLEQAEYDRAVVPLRRAAAAAGHPAQGPAVAYLAAAYLLADRPKEANEALFRARNLVAQEGTRAEVEVLDALARVRLAGQAGGVSRDASDLLTALLAYPKDSFLGPVGTLLFGHGYEALGMRARAAEVYEAALPALQGPLAEEMTYRLAAYRLETLPEGKGRLLAVKMLDALASLSGSRWAAPAQYYLAQVALQEDRPRECLQRCQRLLRDPGSVPRPGVLKLMGRGFSQMGEHRLAAQCFAGEAPAWQPP